MSKNYGMLYVKTAKGEYTAFDLKPGKAMVGQRDLTGILDKLDKLEEEKRQAEADDFDDRWVSWQ